MGEEFESENEGHGIYLGCALNAHYSRTCRAMCTLAVKFLNAVWLDAVRFPGFTPSSGKASKQEDKAAGCLRYFGKQKTPFSPSMRLVS
ncbi:hypothetical protein AVEN_175905-1 [Araneus ventricosus]|uniref:Uncharacterized protein n=1 Tax=Araneus ventricosus TaxID=182803 RepID=A0A4Y2EFY2_ARAVE|nr:hypothetical protein AVEN_175905-1 [Araneus ventricosus]